MYKKILVPLDGSSRAEKILPHIVMMAKCMQAEVILLRVYRVDFGGAETVGNSPEFYDAIARSCRESVVSYLHNTQEKLNTEDLKVKSFAEEGDIVSTILAVANREGADLIAMSSHGRTGLAQFFYGSVAVGVLHKVDRPLLLIRADKD